MTDSYKQILAALIVGIIVLILAFFLAAVTRRVLNARKYAEMDRHRKAYREKIVNALLSGATLSIIEDLRDRPSSLQWRAVEEVLFDLITQGKYKKEGRQIFFPLPIQGALSK